MSLLSTYSSANQVDFTSTNVRYSVTRVGSYYRVTRMATRRYSYVGMTKAAAVTCAEAKIAQYTRTYCKLSTTTSPDGIPDVYYYTANKATVYLSRGSGESWNVDISVNEEDVRAMEYAPPTLETLEAVFFSENARNYDDPFQPYTITLSGGNGSATVSSNIPGFNGLSCVVQGKVSSSDEWAAIPASWIGNSSFTYSSTYTHVRVLYGEYESNAI